MTTSMKRIVLAFGALALAAPAAEAQWVQQHETYYLQAPHNWEFRVATQRTTPGRPLAAPRSAACARSLHTRKQTSTATP